MVTNREQHNCRHNQPKYGLEAIPSQQMEEPMDYSLRQSVINISREELLRYWTGIPCGHMGLQTVQNDTTVNSEYSIKGGQLYRHILHTLDFNNADSGGKMKDLHAKNRTKSGPARDIWQSHRWSSRRRKNFCPPVSVFLLAGMSRVGT